MMDPDPADSPAAAPAATGKARTETTHDTAFRDFYTTNIKPLVAFLLLQGASLVDAADVTQDTMAAAYRCWHTIEHPRAWAYRVASRALIRRASAVHETPVAELTERSPLLRKTEIELWELRHDVVRAIAGLPPRQRQVMAWTLAGYTPSEIADELQLTPEAVRSNIYKARRALHSQLSGKEGYL